MKISIQFTDSEVAAVKSYFATAYNLAVRIIGAIDPSKLLKVSESKEAKEIAEVMSQIDKNQSFELNIHERTLCGILKWTEQFVDVVGDFIIAIIPIAKMLAPRFKKLISSDDKHLQNMIRIVNIDETIRLIEMSSDIDYVVDQLKHQVWIFDYRADHSVENDYYTKAELAEALTKAKDALERAKARKAEFAKAE